MDTGHALTATLALLSARPPRSLEFVTLLNKESRRAIDVAPRWVGFEIDDRFVVGYGLDLDECFRNLPYITDITKLPIQYSG